MFGYQLTRSPWYKKPRIQRGRWDSSGRGNYSGRGLKGQGSRTGTSMRSSFEGGQTPLIQRLPKLRGFKRHFKLLTKYQPVNLSALEADVRVENGMTITLENLIVRGYAHKNDMVKILGNWDISKKLSFSGIHKFSTTAQEKITAAGGSIA